MSIFLYPPLAFVIFLLLGMLILKLSSFLSYKNDLKVEGATKSYACGEDFECQRIKPDYTSFFSFAFFFTLMHVVALMVATIPRYITGIPPITLIYMLSSFLGLFILFRK